jgi:diaminohydroxyphosphoribosylaminopyrimidine deaminase / 5-amino-6-(5-phosphoribosylamino)uracil reductase
MAVSTHMQRALALARKARHRTSPNPMVGAVLVRDGKVVGEGYHKRAGGPHAEIAALKRAGESARGATLYVTLEPCAHQGRTGPCTEALLAAGVSTVVAALPDPDPRVSGEGLARLKAGGVEVEVGDGAAEAEAINQRWLDARRQRRPFVALKYAATLDGKIASATGDSRWVTGEPARRQTHLLRQAYEAVAVGAGTVITDDPELTARSAAGGHFRRQPVRIVIDGNLRVSPAARIFDPRLPGRALVATTESAARRRGKQFESVGVELRAFPGSDRIEVGVLLEFLSGEGINSLLVEGGGDLAWSFLASGAVDRAYAFFAPRLLGGGKAHSPVDGAGFPTLAAAAQMRFVNTRTLGDDVLLEAVAR